MKNVSVSFCNAGPVLFGCATYVPPLMEYVNKYGINLDFGYNLFKVNCAKKLLGLKLLRKDLILGWSSAS